MEEFTKLQGQYLAFIVAYTKLNRRAAAEAIVTRERQGVIRRTSGRARSIEVTVPAGRIPPLD